MTPIELAAAHRAIDEREIRKHGPLVPILKAKTTDTAVRRAALALSLHWHGAERVEPHEVVPVLGMGRLLNGWSA